MVSPPQYKPNFFLPLKFSIITVSALVLLLILSLLNILIKPLHKKKSPNIILISIDALRPDHLGCYGYGRATSPNIDTLAKEGTLFFNAFSHVPKTTQSFMSIMTSLHPDVHQVQLWEKNERGKRLDDSVPTLAELLKNKGYTTVAFTGGGNVSAVQGFDKGFDLYFELYPDIVLIHNAISWLKANYRKNFFLFLYTTAVHDPYLPPPAYSKKYYPDYNGQIPDSRKKLYRQIKSIGYNWWDSHDVFWKNVNKEDPRDVNFLIAQYDAAISSMDTEMVGLLLKELKELNIDQKTLVVITADHGEAFGEHNNFLHDDLYAETLRAPLIINYPRLIPKNKTIKQLVRLTDIMPTLLDIAGIRTNIFMQGESLMPAIMKDKDLNLSCYSVYKGIKALRTNKYTLIEKIDDTGRNCQSYLYNRQIGPKEKDEITAGNPDILDEMKRQLDKQIRDCERLSHRYKPTEADLPDSDYQKLLKSMGYLN